jgi:hypothetical protein
MAPDPITLAILKERLEFAPRRAGVEALIVGGIVGGTVSTVMTCAEALRWVEGV